MGYQVNVPERASLYQWAQEENLPKNAAHQWVNDWLRAVQDYVKDDGNTFSERPLRVATALFQEMQRAKRDGREVGTIEQSHGRLAAIANMPGKSDVARRQALSRGLRALKDAGFVETLREAVGGDAIPRERHSSQVVALAFPREVEARLYSHRTEHYSEVPALEEERARALEQKSAKGGEDVGKRHEPCQKTTSSSFSNVGKEQHVLSKNDMKRVGKRGAYSSTCLEGGQDQESEGDELNVEDWNDPEMKKLHGITS
ncbi:hypothetical protein ACUY3M_00675 [Corynebacterium suicordis]